MVSRATREEADIADIMSGISTSGIPPKMIVYKIFTVYDCIDKFTPCEVPMPYQGVEVIDGLRERYRGAACRITVTHIKFNHNPNSLTADAFNIRVNGTQDVSVPEWHLGVVSPEDSKAAYAIEETTNQVVTIQCRFTISPKRTTRARVKATGGGLLGAIGPINVNFVNGVSYDASHGGDPEYVQIPLHRRSFTAIDRQDIAWRWYYRCPGDLCWRSIPQTTRHRIYVTLRAPPAPWSQTVPVDNPWTWALDYAIDQASTRGLNDEKPAASRIVQHVNGEPLAYDIMSGAPRYYSGGMFQISAWLGGFANGTTVNCYDCASAVTTFANVVGARLQYNYHSPFGYLKHVFPIGRGECNNPFYGSAAAPYNVPIVAQNDPNRTRFGNHAYAKTSVDQNDFDACMRTLAKPLGLVDIVLIILVLLGLAGWSAKRQLAQRGGWLIDMPQPDYRDAVQDTALGPPTGTPAPQPLHLSP